MKRHTSRRFSYFSEQVTSRAEMRYLADFASLYSNRTAFNNLKIFNMFIYGIFGKELNDIINGAVQKLE